jgi:hypothetical protein
VSYPEDVQVLLLALISAVSTSTAYEVQVNKVDDPIARITVRRHGRILWRRTAQTNCVAWNRPRTLVAYVTAPDAPWKYGLRLFVWRAGHPIKSFHIPPLPDNYGEGTFENSLKLSPDGAHALVLTAPTSGSYDLGVGWLVCMKLHSGLSALVAPSTEQFQWLDANSFRHTEMRTEGEGENVRHRFETRVFDIRKTRFRRTGRLTAD